MTRLIICAVPTRMKFTLTKVYFFSKASTSGLAVSTDMAVYQTSEPSFFAPSMSLSSCGDCPQAAVAMQDTRKNNKINVDLRFVGNVINPFLQWISKPQNGGGKAILWTA